MGASPVSPAPSRTIEPWCRIVEHPDGYLMQFGGSDLDSLHTRLDSFRAAIPPQRRRWSADTKTWWVDSVIERMCRSLSRWASRWFAPEQVQRESAPDAIAGAWNCAFDTGDSVTEGWVLQQVKAEGAVPRVNGPSGAWGPTPVPRGSNKAGAYATTPPGRPANGWQRPSTPLALPPVQDPVLDAYATLWLRPGAPWPVIKAAFRALANTHHPDKGGDGNMMQRVNAAHALLRNVVGDDQEGAGLSKPSKEAESEVDEDDGFSI
jgi:hypothetical protein